MGFFKKLLAVLIILSIIILLGWFYIALILFAIYIISVFVYNVYKIINDNYYYDNGKR